MYQFLSFLFLSYAIIVAMKAYLIQKSLSLTSFHYFLIFCLALFVDFKSFLSFYLLFKFDFLKAQFHAFYF